MIHWYTITPASQSRLITNDYRTIITKDGPASCSRGSIAVKIYVILIITPSSIAALPGGMAALSGWIAALSGGIAALYAGGIAALSGGMAAVKHKNKRLPPVEDGLGCCCRGPALGRRLR